MSNDFSLCIDKSQCNFHTKGQLEKKNRENSKNFFILRVKRKVRSNY